jgi:hypothetical protein
VDEQEASRMATRLLGTSWGNRLKILQAQKLPASVLVRKDTGMSFTLRRVFVDEEETAVEVCIYKELDEETGEVIAIAYIWRTVGRSRSQDIIFKPEVGDCLVELLRGTHPSEWVKKACWPDN